MKRTAKPKQDDRSLDAWSKVILDEKQDSVVKAPQFIINKAGFRKELDSYFPKYMFTMKKQISPFIVVQGNEIYRVELTQGLFCLPPEVTIFHAWPGKYRTDLFVFTIEEMLDWFAQQPAEYQENYNRVCALRL
jgi:hypothetical protein